MESDSKCEDLTQTETNFKYKVITKETEANFILSTILKDKNAVIGVDIEAAVEMSRFGILCLIQVNKF
jgi:hypothetical protein